MSRRKVFKSIDEQVEILKNKGVIIRDMESTRFILYRENYFFISGYRHLFMEKYNDKRYIEGTTFEELYATFMFDRAIRNIIFKYILIIENNTKSIISYQLSRKYGYREKEYLNPKNFTTDAIKARQVKDVLNKIKRQIRVNGKKHMATSHYMTNYGYVPLWILVKVISFGMIGELYNILKMEDKLDISDYYEINTEDLSTYLSLLSNFRNICAHEEVLYEHRTQRQIRDNRFHIDLDIERDYEGIYRYGKNDLFAVIIILKQMLTKDEFNGLLFEIGYEIDILDGKVDTVPLSTILNKMGFPTNWRNIEGL